MKRLQKVISGCLAASMMLPLAACGKKGGKAEVPEEEDFIKYLEEKLGADENDDKTVDIDDCNNGFYYVAQSFSSPFGRNISDGKMNFKIAESMQSARALRHVTSGVFGSSTSGWQDYGVEDMVCYMKYDYDLSDAKKLELETTTTSEQECEQYLTCAMLFTFDDEDGAEECFKKMMDEVFTNFLDDYENVLQTIEEDPARMKLYYAPFMFDEDAEFQVRDVIKLKKLPEDVYKLDSKTHTGHFSYHADHRWAGVADIYRVKDVPEWIRYNQVSMDFTILLQDDRIMVLCQYNEYWRSGVTDVYYDEWPQIQFEEKDTIGSIYKKYNVKDPKKIELSDDLKTELIYTSGFERDKGSTIFSPEVYKTSDQADA